MLKYLTCLISNILLIVIVFTTLSFPQYASSQSTDFLASKLIGNSNLESLAKEYWQWWIGVPSNATDMELNPFGCVIGNDEKNSTIFLIDAYNLQYVSNCSIPSDKFILVPLLVGECDQTLPQFNNKYPGAESLKDCLAKTNMNFEGWEVNLDNQVLLKQNGIEKVNPEIMDRIFIPYSSEFNLTIPNGNQYDAKPGSYLSMVGGWYLPLNPLSPGEHSLKYNIIQKPEAAGLTPIVTGNIKYTFDVN